MKVSSPGTLNQTFSNAWNKSLLRLEGGVLAIFSDLILRLRGPGEEGDLPDEEKVLVPHPARVCRGEGGERLEVFCSEQRETLGLSTELPLSPLTASF